MVKYITKHFTVVFLVAIFILALFLRTVDLAHYPVGFQTDEAILGYTGYSLIHTMKDTDGVFLPMYTEVFGDYIPTGYHFLTVPAILVFGLSEFTTRLPGALMGALTVFPVFFLSYAILRKRNVSLCAALFFSISPWSLILSRGSSEASVSVFFVLSGFALIIESLRHQKLKYLIAGGVFLILSFFFYHTPRVFVPLMIISLCMYMMTGFERIKKRAYKRNLILVSLFIVLVVGVLTLSFKGSTARFNQISIFSFPETRLVMEEQIREDGVFGGSIALTRLFHNKIINNAFAFTQNYAEYLSINTLFLRPGLPKMFEVPNAGLIYIVFLPFFFLGLARLLFEKDKIAKLALVWILIAPIVGALTVDDVPNMRRASVLFPMVEIVCVYGLFYFLGIFRKSKKYIRDSVIAVLMLAVFWNFIYFEHQYFVHLKEHRPWFRNNGFGSMMNVVNKNYNFYDKIVMTKAGGGYPLVLFYSQYDPAAYIKEGSPKDRDFKGFGKYLFVSSDCPFLITDPRIPRRGKIMYIENGTCAESKELLKLPFQYVLREDGTKAFRIVFSNHE